MKSLQNNKSTSTLIKVLVTPNAKEAKVTRISDANYEVKVNERATEGKANKRLVEILSEHFNIPKSKIAILKGAKSRDKIVKVILDSPRLV